MTERYSGGIAGSLALAFVFLVAASFAQEDSSGPAEESLDLIDFHNHVMRGLDPDRIVAEMDRAGVRKIVLMGLGTSQPERDDLALAAFEKHPDRIVPFLGLNGYRRFPETMLDYLDGRLATGKFKGMGELCARHYPFSRDTPGGHHVEAGDYTMPADSEESLALFALAAKRGVILVIHMESTPETVPALERALEQCPGAKVIWAHQDPVKTYGGAEEKDARRGDPALVARLLDRFPNLYADIAVGYESMFLEARDRELPAAWKDLYEKHSGRFLAGCDMPFLHGWDEGAFARRAEWIRVWLRQLSPEARAKIAFENAESLLSPSPPEAPK
ncbi:MAG: amidohydrolase family protein [Planctomycetes bacterium]|nr:amidohydrolase family protein [Planctomycetota bacterium]